MILFRKKQEKFYHKEKKDKRLVLLVYFFSFCTLLIIGKLFDFQVLKFDSYSALASGQHEIYKTLFPERGSIYIKDKKDPIFDPDENLFPLAINKDYNLVYAQPIYLKQSPEEIAKLLSSILELSEEELIGKLSKQNDPYEPLKHKVEDSQAELVKNLNIEGIQIAKETFRYYPEKNIGANVLGFVGFDKDGLKSGQYGIEGYFNKELSGSQGEILSDKDTAGRLISIGEKKFIRAKDGDDIVLTLDKTLQYELCSRLNEHAKVIEAENGVLIVMESKTGAILAMCSYPDFDPNEYNKVEDLGVYNNRAVSEPYEIGSIFKAVTMAAGLDLEAITPDTTYFDEGSRTIDDFNIRNWDKKAHGTQTMTEVLQHSLNLGTIFVVEQTGKDNFKRYVEKFGFGQKTGIQLENEAAGNIDSLKKKGDIWAATASFGQGITATPLQMVQAYGAIANDGQLIKPYIVDEIRTSEGNIIKNMPSKVVQVMDSKTATILTGMLVNVVEKGEGTNARVPGYYVAGKTGTAQIPDYKYGGYSNRTNHSFIGFAPIEDPIFTMIIKFENPKKGSFASVTCAPLFSRLAKFILDYYHIMPDKL
ncbi:penicillin-binding protein 2 [Candidatus Falkowbacteria bacterium]|nr:penicillin-binding protein 2 [Candidatus Falkowbacteria bacterium]